MTFPTDLPSQTYTFLFTDLEGSTRLWEKYPEAMKAALERHDALLRAAVEASNGRVVKTTGDGLNAVFLSTLDGVRACLKAQRSLQNEPWGETGPLPVRMGLHVGEAQPRGGDYYGPAVNRAARLMAAAHGGQVLLSSAAASLVEDLLPEGTALDDLGEHRLKDLARPEHVYQLQHPDLPGDFPPLVSLDRRPNNLPAQPTALIGREAELAEVVKRLGPDGTRLLTLTGPGGIGKTRLALQAGAELIDRFEDGVFFVDLAPIRDPQGVLPTIAQALGLRVTSDRPLLDELKARLHARKMLLVLDNFEQVTGAASTVVELLRDSPLLKLLVTSREALHVRGEQIFPIPPLAMPEPGLKKQSLEQLTQYEAVRLFIERAQAVKPDFQVTNENAPAVAEICWRLDGLPLAIELAAARIRLFSPAALLERLGSRLKLLRGGARDLPARQQTLRDAIDWSYDLLDPGEQRLFEVLSVFSGGCTFEAFEAVAAAVAGEIEGLDEMEGDFLDGLASLADKSLVRQVEQDTGEPRLLMLETIREYATERLQADPDLHRAAQRAHAVHFATFSLHQWERLTGGEREPALVDLSADIENARAAWSFWVGERDLEQLGKLVDGLWLFYDIRGWYYAAVDLTTDLLAVLSSTPSTPELAQEEIVLQTSLARALLAIKGYTPEVEAAYTRALELSRGLGEIPQLFPILRGLASLYVYLGNFEKGAQVGEQILRLAERLDDAGMRVEGNLVRGYSLAFVGHIPEGLDYLEKSIAGYDPARHGAHRFYIGNNPGVTGFNVSALLLWLCGFPDRALTRANQAIALATRLKHPYSMAYALFHTGLLHLWRREAALAYDRLQEVVNIAMQHEYQVWNAVATCLQGAALAGLGRPEEGLVRVQQSIEVYQGLKTPPVFLPMLLIFEAEVCGLAGKPGQGLSVMDKTLQIIGSDSKDIFAGEFYRLQGELLLALSPENAADAAASAAAQAETWFLRALENARDVQAGMVELRAAISLCRLWSRRGTDQGKAEQGRRTLEDVYSRMTEGFATADLMEASKLLGG